MGEHIGQKNTTRINILDWFLHDRMRCISVNVSAEIKISMAFVVTPNERPDTLNQYKVGILNYCSYVLANCGKLNNETSSCKL